MKLSLWFRITVRSWWILLRDLFRRKRYKCFIDPAYGPESCVTVVVRDGKIIKIINETPRIIRGGGIETNIR